MLLNSTRVSSQFMSQKINILNYYLRKQEEYYKIIYLLFENLNVLQM